MGRCRPIYALVSQEAAISHGLEQTPSEATENPGRNGGLPDAQLSSYRSNSRAQPLQSTGKRESAGSLFVLLYCYCFYHVQIYIIIALKRKKCIFTFYKLNIFLLSTTMPPSHYSLCGNSELSSLF